MENTLPNAQVLPWAIANSIVTIYEDKFFSKLYFSTKKVFATLIRVGLNIDSPTQSIFVKKSTIAKLLGINESTVYRALSKLEEEGLIEREAQNRNSSNLKVIGKIRITKIALKAFGIENYLNQMKIKKNESIENKNDAQAKASNLAQMQDNNNKKDIQFLQRQSEQRSFKKIQGRSVPQDLAWLVEENELKISGLFKLMKTAREQGKRLSDIVAVCIHSLRKLNGHFLFAYLRKLISKEYDFGYVRAMQEQERIEKQREVEAKHQIEIAQTTLCGKKFRLNSGRFIEFSESVIYFFDAVGRNEGCCPYGKGTLLIKKVISGSLEAVSEIPLPPITAHRGKSNNRGCSNQSLPFKSLKSALKTILRN